MTDKNKSQAQQKPSILAATTRISTFFGGSGNVVGACVGLLSDYLKKTEKKKTDKIAKPTKK